MTDKYIIALDQGTTSCRALLVNAEGRITGMQQQEFTQIFPQAGWVEHDAMEILTVQMDVLSKLLSEADLKAEQIAGIGITNQRETTVVWDKNTGQPVYNAIVWQDKRTSEYCAELKAEGVEALVKQQTGLPIDPYFSGTKLKWILDKVGRSEALLFGTIDTWLIWNMTEGRSHVTDHTNASRTLLYDIQQKKWSQDILQKLNIPASVLPEVQNSASHFGEWTYEGKHIPILGVAGDQQAALFGQACFTPGSAKNTYGTGCFMLMNIGQDLTHSANGLLTTLACDKEGKPCYALEGSIFMAGATIQWLRDGLQIIKDSSETQGMAESIREDYDVIMVPAFAGLGAPFWDMNSRGAIFGMTRGTTSAHLAKAALEAMAYRSRDVLDAMEKDSGVHLQVLKVDGGACKNDYLMQFQSDMLQVDVERPMDVESTALGAAYLAGLTAGLWDHQMISAQRKVDKRYTPAMVKEKVEELYADWQDAIRRTLSTEEA